MILLLFSLFSLYAGLLWIKVLAFLKVVNKDMAVFILALIQILCDLRYFAVVLVVIIIMVCDEHADCILLYFKSRTDSKPNVFDTP